MDNHLYHTTFQTKGNLAHKNIDENKYSTKKNILESIPIYSEELGVIGKIDLFDVKNKTLIERKNKIKVIYEGYYLQIYAQYFCLIEMGYDVQNLKLYSLSDNKNYNLDIPNKYDKIMLKSVIDCIRNFRLEDTNFTQNPNKCKMCIYRQLCDYYHDE